MRNYLTLSYIICNLIIYSSIASASSITRIEPGDKIDSHHQLGQSSFYTLELQDGEYALLQLDQRGIDLVIDVIGPDGQKIETFDSNNGAEGHEIILINAKQAGEYKILVCSLGENKKVRSGSYRLQYRNKTSDLRDHLHQTLMAINDRELLPGFAVSVLNKDGVLFQNGYGWADLEGRIPFTIHSLGGVASVSKTFIGVALMQLAAEGRLDLEMPINDILPFDIDHPYHHNVPIRVKHLASHTGGLNYSKYYSKKAYVLQQRENINKVGLHKNEYEFFSNAKENEMLNLETYFKNMYTKSGPWYSKKNFTKSAPGEKFKYSNSGAALAAYIVELISGQSFAEYTEANIFKPLGLKHTSWTVNKLDTQQLVRGYGIYRSALPRYAVVTYPDGGLVTSVHDLSRYFISLLRSLHGESDLIPELYARMMMSPQARDGKRSYGYFWEFTSKGQMGHSGGDAGMLAYMFCDQAAKAGCIILCNMTYQPGGGGVAFTHIRDVLNRYKGSLDIAGV